MRKATIASMGGWGRRTIRLRWFLGERKGRNAFVCAAHAVTLSYTRAIGTIIVIKPGKGVARRSLKGTDDDHSDGRGLDVIKTKRFDV